MAAMGGSLHPRVRAPPTSCMQEVGSSSCRCTAPPSRQEEASSDDSMEMWVVHRTAHFPLRLGTPPPLAHLGTPGATMMNACTLKR
jgi:hypothetical protein